MNIMDFFVNLWNYINLQIFIYIHSIFFYDHFSRKTVKNLGKKWFKLKTRESDWSNFLWRLSRAIYTSVGSGLGGNLALDKDGGTAPLKKTSLMTTRWYYLFPWGACGCTPRGTLGTL